MAFLVAENGVSNKGRDLTEVRKRHGLNSLVLDRSQAVVKQSDAPADELLEDSRQPESVAAVLKVFGILQALADQRAIGVSELSQRLAMPKATVYRFLQTMKTLGYVHQEQESEHYGLTMRLHELGSKALAFPDLLRIADLQMRLLSSRCQEALHMGVLVDGEVVYIHKVDSPGVLNFGFRIGQRIPAYCSAVGKVLLAFTPAEISDTLISGLQIRPVQPATHRTEISLRADIERVRQQGFALDMQEFDQNLCCLAVPVLDYLHNVVAGLSMALPVFGYNPVRQGEYISMLHQAARDISGQLGCTDYPF
ncbi:MAG: DNA-binding transcriptional regulator KdgR [Proteobacteria bacterium]|nr:DNA-binding transcriptional regulator KdgR [Pseudomonadota bacterium]